MNVTGYIVSAATGEPLPNAHAYVMRNGQPHGTTANLEGFYSFDVEPDELVTVSYVGHETETVIAGDYDGAPFVHTLQPVELAPFEVVGTRPRYGLVLLVLLAIGVASSR